MVSEKSDDVLVEVLRMQNGREYVTVARKKNGMSQIENYTMRRACVVNSSISTRTTFGF